MQEYLYAYEAITFFSTEVEHVRMHKIYTNDHPRHPYDFKFYIKARHRGSFYKFRFSNAEEFCKMHSVFATTPEEALRKHISELKKSIAARTKQMKSAQKQLKMAGDLDLSSHCKSDQLTIDVKRLWKHKCKNKS